MKSTNRLISTEHLKRVADTVKRHLPEVGHRVLEFGEWISLLAALCALFHIAHGTEALDTYHGLLEVMLHALRYLLKRMTKKSPDQQATS